jgi:hypothetical protein
MNTSKTKRMALIGASLLTTVLAAGCSMEGHLENGQENRIVDCTDVRDGEKFTFNSDTIKDIRYGIFADSCFTVTIESGKERTLCKSHEAWLKCKDR